jgi:hypothetical protein
LAGSFPEVGNQDRGRSQDSSDIDESLCKARQTDISLGIIKEFYEALTRNW